jgi:hypothetical protein
MKIMAIVDRHGLPLSVSTHAANHHEVRLVQLCFDFYIPLAKREMLRFLQDRPRRKTQPPDCVPAGHKFGLRFLSRQRPHRGLQPLWVQELE